MVEKDLIKLHDPHKFDERFIEKTQECSTYEQAYHEVEKEHKKIFGTRKYSSYNSYRNSRAERLKRKSLHPN